MSVGTTTCPRCGAAASGNFCAACGSRLSAAACTGCGEPLPAGANFCHRCGAAAAGGIGTASDASRTPWLVAAVLIVLAVGAVGAAAARRGAADAPAMANAGNATAATGTPAATGPAPDISGMTPRQQFDRLYDRVMSSAQANDTSSVIQFWPMTAGAYARLSPVERDVDAQFHMADLQLLIGQFPEAVALTDTILTRSADNLMAFYVRALVAEFQGDSTAARDARAAFRRNYVAQIDREQAEYTHHRAMLDQYRQSIGEK